MSLNLHIRSVRVEDIPRLTDIYNGYIANTTITFEMTPVSPQTMGQRVEAKTRTHAWLVGEVNQEVIGYAYYGNFHARPAYRHTAESSIYLAPEYTRQGWGRPLYTALLQSAQKQGFQEMIALIALPNPGSIRLHQQLGFEPVGVLKRVGYKLDRYVDVAIWQASLG